MIKQIIRLTERSFKLSNGSSHMDRVTIYTVHPYQQYGYLDRDSEGMWYAQSLLGKDLTKER